MQTTIAYQPVLLNQRYVSVLFKNWRRIRSVKNGNIIELINPKYFNMFRTRRATMAWLSMWMVQWEYLLATVDNLERVSLQILEKSTVSITTCLSAAEVAFGWGLRFVVLARGEDLVVLVEEGPLEERVEASFCFIHRPKVLVAVLNHRYLYLRPVVVQLTITLYNMASIQYIILSLKRQEYPLSLMVDSVIG